MSDEIPQYVTHNIEDATKMLKKQVRPIVATCNKTAYDVQKFGVLLESGKTPDVLQIMATTKSKRNGRKIVKNLNRLATQY